MTSPDPAKRICIGKISSSHGVKGLVKIHPYCEDVSLLKGELFTSDNPNDPNTLAITLKNSLGKYYLASIEGITNPEDAKKLKYSLYIPREALPDIEDDGEFYIKDLVGLEVKEDGHSDILGTIQNVENFGAGELLEIKPNNGTPSYYVPFHNDYIDDIDLDERCIMLKNTELFRIG